MIRKPGRHRPASAATACSSVVSPAGKVWQSMVSDLLAAEFDRRKTLAGRGATLLTASASLVTLIFGLTVIVTGKITCSPTATRSSP